MTTVADAPTTKGPKANGHTDPYQDPGPTRIEIWKPPTDGIHGYFDVQILDPYGVEPINIIKEETKWKVRFRVWLYGEIWKCVSGVLCTDVFFNRANDGEVYKLSELVGEDALRYDFEGCRFKYEEGHLHLEWDVEVPAGKLPAGEYKPAFYPWSAVLTFEDPCGNRGVLSGFDKGHILVWDAHPDTVPAN